MQNASGWMLWMFFTEFRCSIVFWPVGWNCPSLVVLVLKLRYRLPDGSRQNSLWLGWWVSQDALYGAPVEGQDALYGAPVEGQDALYGAPVEDAEYPGVHVELPQPAEQWPHNVQGLFTRRENMLRGNCIFLKPPIRTNCKRHCITTGSSVE